MKLENKSIEELIARLKFLRNKETELLLKIENLKEDILTFENSAGIKQQDTFKFEGFVYIFIFV